MPFSYVLNVVICISSGMDFPATSLSSSAVRAMKTGFSAETSKPAFSSAASLSEK